MGVGKSTIAPLVGAELGRPTVDLDEQIARTAGQSIAEIFASLGERRFREIERASLLEALGREDAPVIAAGGGALLEQSSRDVAHRRALVVGLTAPVETLARRLESQGARPLLLGKPSTTSLRVMLDERASSYDDVPLAFDTSLASPHSVASRIARAANAQYEPLSRGRVRSWVQVTDRPWEALANEVARSRPTRVAVVTDQNVAALYLTECCEALGDAPLAPPIVMTAGEGAKSFDGLAHVLRKLLANEMDRGSLVVTLGGGVVSDLGGLAAAIYMRGIPWVAVATSTVAMADAAIGGKTAIDLDGYKNCVGAFHLPLATISAPSLIATEAPRNRRSGLAEALKTFAVADAESFLDAERFSSDEWEQPATIAGVIRRTVALKASIVASDPHDRGRRRILNFGHTVGHALESVGGFDRWLHGEAVSLGMVAASRIGERLGVTPHALTSRILSALETAGLPTRLAKDDLALAAAAIVADKKRAAGVVTMVLLENVGRAILREIGVEQLQELMRSVGDA